MIYIRRQLPSKGHESRSFILQVFSVQSYTLLRLGYPKTVRLRGIYHF